MIFLSHLDPMSAGKFRAYSFVEPRESVENSKKEHKFPLNYAYLLWKRWEPKAIQL